MAVGYDVGSQVNLVWASGDIPQSTRGQIQEVIGGLVVVSPGSADATLPTKDAKLVLCLSGEENVKVTARVVEQKDGLVSLLPSNYQHLSRRDYPRVDTDIEVMHRLNKAPGELSEGRLKALSDWTRPISDTVNLSVNGLSFLTAIPVPEDSILDIRVHIPGGPEGAYEMKGHVVRCFEVPDEASDDGDHAYRLAIQLIDLSDEVRDAFVDYTLQTQSALLSEFEDEAEA